MVNTHWGGVTENNHFGTHEFLELCAQLGTEPYICGNVGSGTVEELADWVEYVTFDGKSPMADLRRANGREQPWKVQYWGVGNENWGCGGDMRPEYYADQFRRYATYVRGFGGNRPFKIACGANSFDYNWTEALMREAGRYMQGLALHYYCGTGKQSRSATKFTEEDWFHQLRSALRMEELVRKHGEIMDKYDREKRVAMIVDEWGAWHEVEPGTNPGFLYQQNSIRDALVASVTFDIFHAHADRVRMANIAQTVNVLQAMVLTDKEKMILTPTYHVFEMYKVHQDATMLPTAVACTSYAFGADALPQLSASASRDKAGKLHVSVSNLDPNRAAPLVCQLAGFTPRAASGRVLTADTITAHNTFDAPEVVKPKPLEGMVLEGSTVKVTLPAKCVAVIEIE
jgi:alpha-N-arabinofuranosidase